MTSMADRARLASISLLAIPLFITSCSGLQASEAGGSPPREATYVTSEYKFAGPDTLAAGWTTLHLKNEGKELHHLALLRLDDGKTVDDFEAYMKTGATSFPEWSHEYGGPNAVIGPVTGTAIVKLDPGSYVAVCLIPAADGMPHMAKGMLKPITVTGSGGGSPPAADMSVKLGDFTFVHGDPYTAGKHTIEVTNIGKQPHEIVLAKLDPGKTAQDLAAAFAPGAPQGPPPGTPVGGLTPISPGQVAYFETDLTPGNYAVLCFLEDPASHKVHAELGMIEEFTID
jgi:hypothetical protein